MFLHMQVGMVVDIFLLLYLYVSHFIKGNTLS